MKVVIMRINEINLIMFLCRLPYKRERANRLIRSLVSWNC